MTNGAIARSVALGMTLLGTSAAAAVALNSFGSSQSPRPPNRSIHGIRHVCDLRHLRVAGTDQLPGPGTAHWAAHYLFIRFTNDGRACTVDSKSRLVVTAVTNTHVRIRARLMRTTRPVLARQAVTFVLGAFWKNGPCSSTYLPSVVFRSRRKARAVDLRGRPFRVCTPLMTDLSVAPS